MKTAFLFFSVCFVSFLYSQTDSTDVLMERVENVLSDEAELPQNCIEFNLLGNYPYLYTNNKKIGYNRSYKNNFDYGFKVGYMREISPKFGVGIEYGVDFSNVSLGFSQDRYNNTADGYGYYLLWANIDHEGVDMISHKIVAKIEWKIKGTKLPVGIYNQLGFGISLTTLMDKSYTFEKVYHDTTYISSINEGTDIYSEDNLYDYSQTPFFGYELMYSIGIRVKITEKLLFNCNARFTFGLLHKRGTSFAGSDYSDSEYWITKKQMAWKISEVLMKSHAHLQIGLSYVW